MAAKGSLIDHTVGLRREQTMQTHRVACAQKLIQALSAAHAKCNLLTSGQIRIEAHQLEPKGFGAQRRCGANPAEPHEPERGPTNPPHARRLRILPGLHDVGAQFALKLGMPRTRASSNPIAWSATSLVP